MHNIVNIFTQTEILYMESTTIHGTKNKIDERARQYKCIWTIIYGKGGHITFSPGEDDAVEDGERYGDGEAVVTTFSPTKLNMDEVLRQRGEAIPSLPRKE